MRATGVIAVLGALALAGCGSSKTIVTVTRPAAGVATVTHATVTTTSKPSSSTTEGKAFTVPTEISTGVTQTPTQQTPSPAPQHKPSKPSPPTPKPAPAPKHVIALHHLASFESPSGNIGCIIADGTARCDIRNRDWSPPPHPASCPDEVDFGQGLLVHRTGNGRFVCAGDTALNPSDPKLAYGTASSVDGFTCVSETNGMGCISDTTRKGFIISIQGYKFI